MQHNAILDSNCSCFDSTQRQMMGRHAISSTRWILMLTVLYCGTPSGICGKIHIQYGYVDRNVTLQCPVSSSEDVVGMVWYFQNGIMKTIHTINQTGTYSSSPRYHVNITSRTLTIENINLHDAAFYECKLSDGKMLQNDMVELKIADSHRNDFPLSVVQGFLGHRSKIPCPVPLTSTVRQLLWYAEDSMIYDISELGHVSLSGRYSADHDTGMLTIINTTNEDAIIYTCRAISGRHVQEYNVKLDFNDVAERYVYAEKGENITLICPAQLSHDQTLKITWMKKQKTSTLLLAVWTKDDSRPLVRSKRKHGIDNSNGALKLTPFKTEAVYVCQKQPEANIDRPSGLASIHVIDVDIRKGKLDFMESVFITPENVEQQQILNENSTLKPGYVVILQVCADDFSLPPKIKWFRNGERLRSNCKTKIEIRSSKCQGTTSRLTYNVTAHNNGDNITAAAFGQNGVLWQKSSSLVTLTVKPMESMKIKISTGNNVTRLYHTLTVQCFIRGYNLEPETSIIRWREHTNNLILWRNSTPLLHQAEDGMAAADAEIAYNVTMRLPFQKFCCECKQHSACSYIEVQFPPETIVVKYFEDDKTIKLECLVHSYPDYREIQWWRNSHRITGNQSVLVLEKPNLSSQDRYSCTAINGIEGAVCVNSFISNVANYGVFITLIILISVFATSLILVLVVTLCWKRTCCKSGISDQEENVYSTGRVVYKRGNIYQYDAVSTNQETVNQSRYVGSLPPNATGDGEYGQHDAAEEADDENDYACGTSDSGSIYAMGTYTETNQDRIPTEHETLYESSNSNGHGSELIMNDNREESDEETMCFSS